jgi:LacI family transcriptional regulator
VEEAIARDGYSAIVANAGGSTARAVAAAESLIARRVEGLVSASAELDDPVVSLCADARMPLVLVNRAEDRLRTDTVVSDDRKGLKLAVDHLFGLGHRRIGHIAGPANVSTGLWRRDGFARAMSAKGLEASAVVEAASYSRDAGWAAAHELLALAPVTAIAVANDLVALGVCRALADKGLSCPRDVSIIGYNDMPLVDLVEPPLTTIRISSGEMGLRAGARVLAAIRSPGAAPVSDTVQPELVVRRSAAPPRRTADAPGPGSS